MKLLLQVLPILHIPLIVLLLFSGALSKTLPDEVISIFDTDVEICSSTHLCQPNRRCGETPNEAEDCGCDIACEYYGDCCYDYWSACTSEDRPQIESAPFSLLQCIEGDNRFDLGYFAIARCKDDSSVDIETIKKCENPGSDDVLLKIIVSDTEDNIYKNIYCALCNDISINEVSAWEAEFVCDDDEVRSEFGADPVAPNFFPQPRPFSPITTQKPAVTTEAPPPNIHEHLNDNGLCPFINFKPPPGKQDTRRPCFSNLVSECSEKYMNMSVISACMNKYKAIVYGRMVYRNPHCALCNNEQFYVCEQFEVSFRRVGFTSLTVVVDFSSQSSISVSSAYGSYGNKGVNCESDKVFDPFSNQCLQLTCKEGFVLEGSKCVALSLSSDCGDNALHVPIEVYCGCKLLKQSLRIEYEYIEYVEHNFTIVEELTKMLKFRDIKYTKQEKTSLNMTYEVILIKNINCLQVQDISEFVSSGINNSTDDLNSVKLWQNCSTKPFQSDIHCDHDSLLLTIEEEFVYENLTRTINAGNTSVYLPESEYVLQIIHELGNESSVCSILSISDCEACPHVQLDLAGFQPSDNRTLIYKLTGHIFEEEEYILVESSNESVLVCSFLNQTETPQEQIDFFHYSGALLIVSVVCTIISLVTLLITILLRIFITELRTLSGKIILNVSIALFFALLLTLIQGNFTEWETFCMIFSIVLHYLWLVCFCWMNTMAFELFQTFRLNKSSARSSRSKGSQRKTFIKYFIYSWGLPAVYVIIIVSISLCECTGLDVLYGDETVCWIRDGLASFYVFGIPLAVILVPNLLLFLATIRGLRKSLESTAAVRSGKSNQSQQTGQMIIYIRISTVMGLTWVFGFLASFADHVVLWYIFTILNSLQGLFIFIAFNINYSMKNILIKRRENQTSQPKTTETELQPINVNPRSNGQ